MQARTTAAWPLCGVYAGLIVYASLYPFEGWRVQGIAPWSFLLAPLPRYWTGFDVVANALGYAPLGFLGAVAVLRLRPRWPPVLTVTALALALSLLLESLQMFLPMRVPSNVDLALNASGAWLGALLARVLASWGLVAHWSRWRDRWFRADASGALALLALWPLALLFPVAVPFGLGQVFERLEAALARMLAPTPWQEWLPLRWHKCARPCGVARCPGTAMRPFMRRLRKPAATACCSTRCSVTGRPATGSSLSA